MWFKNLKVYSITEALEIDTETLQQQLTELAFRHCGKQELATMGWVAPLEGGAEMFHTTNGNFWLTLKKQERLLPSSVINAELDEKVAQIEQETGSPVGKKAKQDLKQEIVHRLLPQAFTKNSFTHGMLCPKDNLVIVDASADGKAETFLAMLRKAMGSLPVVPLGRTSVSNELTHWLSDNATPSNIELLDEAELKENSEEAGIIRCKNTDLTSEEILNHIESGKFVQKVSVKWEDTLTAILQEDLSVKRLKFTDVLREQNDDIPKDQKAARLDADFALMSGELIRFVEFLTETFQIDAAE